MVGESDLGQWRLGQGRGGSARIIMQADLTTYLGRWANVLWCIMSQYYKNKQNPQYRQLWAVFWNADVDCRNFDFKKIKNSEKISGRFPRIYLTPNSLRERSNWNRSPKYLKSKQKIYLESGYTCHRSQNLNPLYLRAPWTDFKNFGHFEKLWIYSFDLN